MSVIDVENTPEVATVHHVRERKYPDYYDEYRKQSGHLPTLTARSPDHSLRIESHA